MDFITSYIASLDFSNPIQATWYVLTHGGWIVVAIIGIRGFWEMWLLEIRANYYASIDYVLLAINVPKQTEQTPKAVENIFAHLQGTYSGFGNLIDKYWKGKLQENYSVEIVSRGGFIQYYVRIPVKYRDILEASVFAQYPDAEITEAADYVDEFPQDWPDEKYEMWGSEISLSKANEYPIRTYPSFYDQISQSYKDPLASLLEFLGTLRPEESVMIQIPLVPTQDDWHKKSLETVKKLIGAKVAAPKPKGIMLLLSTLLGVVIWPIEHAFGVGIVSGPPQKSAPELPSIMQHLSPGERSIVEQIQIKAGKPGYWAKIRIICIAPKEIMNKQRMIGGTMGALKQFNTLDMNSFAIDKYTVTKANYFRIIPRIIRRQKKVWRNYRGRSSGRGGPMYILNTEELATIWHFPMIDVKAPLISKAEVKRGEPPFKLPIHEGNAYSTPEKVIEVISPTEHPNDTDSPSNIPFV